MPAPILADIVDHWRQRDPHLDVLTFVDIEPDGTLTETVRTYDQIWRTGQQVAAALERAGLERGDTFAIVMQNHAEFVDAMVGASITATVFVPIDPRTRGERLRFMLAFAECRGAIIADYALADVLAVRAALPRLEWLWVVATGHAVSLPADPDVRAWEAVLASAGKDIAIRSTDADATMQLLYTSGTTGEPKAIRSPHSRFGSIASLAATIGLQHDDRPYTGLSLTHANAQFLTLGNAISMGLRAVISRRFTKSRLWDITRRYGCTVFNLLGGMSTAIYAEQQRSDDAGNPVRYVLSAGMPKHLWLPFRERFGVEIFEFYGTAEGGLTLNPPGVGPIGSIGKPPANLELAVFAADDRECAPGEQGEICFRQAGGAPLTVAYHRDAEASARKCAGGWLRTGDIGHVDEDGWLYFDHRAGGSIRRNGEFIDATIVERVLAEMLCIRDVFVYGVHTMENAPGEKELVAAIEVDGDVDPVAILLACRRQLGENTVPRYLQVVDAIPKTASEKPLERVLIETFAVDAPNVYVLRVRSGT